MFCSNDNSKKEKSILFRLFCVSPGTTEELLTGAWLPLVALSQYNRQSTFSTS